MLLLEKLKLKKSEMLNISNILSENLLKNQELMIPEFWLRLKEDQKMNNHKEEVLIHRLFQEVNGRIELAVETCTDKLLLLPLNITLLLVVIGLTEVAVETCMDKPMLLLLNKLLLLEVIGSTELVVETYKDKPMLLLQNMLLVVIGRIEAVVETCMD